MSSEGLIDRGEEKRRRGFFSRLEQLSVERFAGLAAENPALHAAAVSRADEAMGGLDNIIGGDFPAVEEGLRNGFYRIHMDFGRVNEDGSVSSVEDEAISSALGDLVGQAIEKKAKWDSVALEWSLMSLSMRIREEEPNKPFRDPSLRFAYLYGLVLEIGSALIGYDEIDKSIDTN